MVQQLNIPTACNEIIVKEFEVVKEVIGGIRTIRLQKDVYKRQGISHAQAQVTVKGTVISSENNEPGIGASVLVKGTTNGTITDINGQFTPVSYTHLWCLGNTKTNSRTVRTGGINPFHQSVDCLLYTSGRISA